MRSSGVTKCLAGINVQFVKLAERLAGEWIDDRQGVHFVAEEFDAQGVFLRRRPYFQHVAAHAKFAARKSDVVPLVLNIHQAQEQFVAVDGLTLGQENHHALVIGGRTEAVDARHAGDDDDVLAADEGGGGGETQPVDGLVDLRVFFDVNVALRDVGFGLVIVVIADEIMDGVPRKEGAELFVELRGQRLVVGQHQRRLTELCDHVACREGFARARGAEQRLTTAARVKTFDKLGDGFGLIAGGLELAGQLKIRGHVLA